MPASKAQQAQVAERRTRAIQLRMAGLTCQAVADQLGYGTASAASQDINRALAQRLKQEDEQVALMAALSSERLDAMTRTAWAEMRRRHTLVSNGRVMKDEDGAPLPDPDQNLRAIDRLLRIEDRRSKLFGMDAALKVEVSDHVDSEIERLADQLAAAAAGAAAGGVADLVTSSETAPAGPAAKPRRRRARVNGGGAAVAEDSPPEAAATG